MQQRLDVVEACLMVDPGNEDHERHLQELDKEMVEYQAHAEDKCRHIMKNPLPFCEPVKVWVYRKRCWQGLLRRLEGGRRNTGNLVRKCYVMKIHESAPDPPTADACPHPKSYTRAQILDGIKYCRMKLKELRQVAKPLRHEHLKQCYVEASHLEDKKRMAGIKLKMRREEQRGSWWKINAVTDDPKTGAINRVDREERGKIVAVRDKEGMEREIQAVTELRFDLAHSAPVTLSSLSTKLGYLSDTEFAAELLGGRAKIPADVDARTALVLKEICRLGMRLRTDDGEEITVSPDDFRKYWKKAREETSSSTCGIHFGHYRAATKSDKITKFLSQKVTVIARTGLPPERWGNGLQVMLEKIAGIALVNKLRAILLMEADYNFFNKWAFGHQAIGKLYEMGYIPEEQYSQRESTAEDAKMDNRLTTDLSRQLKHPMAIASADASNCYDRINHILMAFLLLAVTGWLGAIVALLYPIQTMKFFQRTAYGDSKTYFGGKDRGRPLQGLCQGNGAAPACWAMLCSVLM